MSYAYTPQERWQFGGTVTYGHSKSNLTPLFSDEVFAYRYVDFYGIAGETSYIFHNREKVKLYALVGAGVSFGKETAIIFLSEEHFVTDYTYFEYQITPIGIRYGKKWGGFAEIGFGYRGILSFGMFYNL